MGLDQPGTIPLELVWSCAMLLGLDWPPARLFELVQPGARLFGLAIGGLSSHKAVGAQTASCKAIGL